VGNFSEQVWGDSPERRQLHRIGWSVQVPGRQAAERDEAAIAAWRQEAWPVIKASSSEWMVAQAEMARAPAAAGGGSLPRAGWA
jgi:hypothetical protein